jgi:hypothetical protein
MDRESARIKIKPNTSPEQLFSSMEQRKMNLSCKEVIKAFEDIISMLFGYNELASFDLEYSSKGHLVIYDKKTGESYTASCHFKNKTDQFNPGQIQRLLRMMDNSIKSRQKESEPQETEATANEMPRFRKVEAKNHGGLDDWFKKEHWVDVSRPKKKGKFQPCGRGDTSKGHKPVCTPANKAKNLSERERKNRVRQKRRKEKEPNPDKKPNVTKYTPKAGGKSNVSNSNNIRFVGSMIPLSELRPKQPKFVKIALFGEEEEIPSTDVSGMFSEQDDKISAMAEQIQEEAFKKLAEILSHQMGLSGPDAPSISSIKYYENPVQEEMTEQEYLRFIRHKSAVLRSMHKQAKENSDSKMYEITYKMAVNGSNPFNYSDIVKVVREVSEN